MSMFYNTKIDITPQTWIRLLQDKMVTEDRDYELLKMIFECENHEASASYIAEKLSMNHYAPLNLQVSRFSKRVLRKTNIDPPKRENGEIRWWHIPFLGYSKAGKFPWILRPELAIAFENLIGFQNDEIVLPEEVSSADEIFMEGKARQIYVNSFERNRFARNKCIEHFGYRCCICSFDFEKIYGSIGKNKIHVHHLKQLSDIKEDYEVDPTNDLRPVCPNCHLIIHSKKIPFTIEEMKQIVRELRDDA